jgi:molybdopterin-guanine dinucleotide biosynthesis protein A
MARNAKRETRNVTARTQRAQSFAEGIRVAYEDNGWSEMSGEVVAAILAGGLSRRMGVNKALLRLDEGGPAVIEMVVARLSEAGFGPPLLVTNTPEEYAFLALQCVPDDIQGAGVPGGILTALNHSASTGVLVVACDMPLLNAALLRYMASVPGDYDALVPRWNDHGHLRVEPLHVIYSKRCAHAIEKQIAEGDLKASSLLDRINVTYLDESTIRRYDPHLKSFFNLNTPEELKYLR